MKCIFCPKSYCAPVSTFILHSFFKTNVSNWRPNPAHHFSSSSLQGCAETFMYWYLEKFWGESKGAPVVWQHHQKLNNWGEETNEQQKKKNITEKKSDFRTKRYNYTKLAILWQSLYFVLKMWFCKSWCFMAINLNFS